MNIISKNKVSDNLWKIRIGLISDIYDRGELDLIVISNKRGEYGIIENVFIEERYREQGIATQLLEETLEICKKMGLYKVVLTCSGPMMSFYTERGFEWQADGQAFCMRANLE